MNDYAKATMTVILTLVLASAFLWASRAHADHFNDPDQSPRSYVPQQCYRYFGELAWKKIKGVTVPCDKNWNSKLYYLNVDGFRVFNNEYCAQAGRGGRARPECWLFDGNSPHVPDDMKAGEAVGCFD